ncbi:MAG TPA: dihydrofolate reductase family protein [Solirubrobacteraceae bacterium]|nr:dihydrofolate reductase family protein [Solirubrobacteraceae bacterium]
MEHLDWARDRVGRLLAAGGAERLVAVSAASADFRAAIGGRSRALSSPEDRALMRAWREASDVLLVGSRTLTVERYGSLVGDGSPPPVVTISRDGRLDLGRILRAKQPPPLTVYARVPRPAAAPVAGWRTWPEVSVGAVVEDLRAGGARVIVCEGGPALLARALEGGVVTDLSLTLAPLAVGAGPPLVAAGRAGPQAVRLLDAAVAGRHVFAHYALEPAPSAQARKSTTT